MRRQEREWVGAIRQHGRKFRFEVVLFDGQRKTVSFDSLEEAERERRAALKARERAEQAAAALRWRQAIDMYCSHLAETGIKERSIETVTGRLKRFFSSVLDDGIHLRTDQADALYKDLRTRKSRRGKPLSVQEHRHCLSRAKAICAWLVKQRHLATNPIKDVEPLGRPRRGKAQLTRDEARKLYGLCLDAGVAGDDGAVACAVALGLGLRAEEICQRTVRDLDDGGKLLHITTAKTEAGVRTLAVPAELRPLLLQRTRGKLPLAPLIGYDRWWLRRQVTRLCRIAEVPVVPPHGLRGTHASLARAAGASAEIVSAALGWAGTEVQERHYARPEAVAAGRQQAAQAVLLAGEAPANHTPAMKRKSDGG